MSNGIHNSRPADRWAAWATLALLGTITGYLALRIAGPYLESVLIGAALAVLFYPLKLALHRRIRNGSLATTLTITVAVLVALVPPILVITTVVRELRPRVQGWSPMAWLSSQSTAYQWIDTIAMRFGSSAAELEQLVQSRLDGAVSALLTGAAKAAGAAGGGVIQFIVIIFALQVFLSRGVWLCEQIKAHSPLGRSRTATLLDTVHGMIRSSFYGVIAVASAQGALLGLAAWICGLPIPALWGIATAAASVIPLVGSALVWVPGTLALLLQGEIGYAIFFVVWGAVVVANADNFLRPMIMMASLNANALAVFIALLGGVQAFGLIGIVVGPVTLAVGVALLEMLREEVQASDPVAVETKEP